MKQYQKDYVAKCFTGDKNLWKSGRKQVSVGTGAVNKWDRIGHDFLISKKEVLLVETIRQINNSQKAFMQYFIPIQLSLRFSKSNGLQIQIPT